jgi:hypothetical protein
MQETGWQKYVSLRSEDLGPVWLKSTFHSSFYACPDKIQKPRKISWCACPAPSHSPRTINSIGLLASLIHE